MMTKNEALQCLASIGVHTPQFLGKGTGTYVFQDTQSVWKVFDLSTQKDLKYKEAMLMSLPFHFEAFKNSEYFYEIQELKKPAPGIFLLSYRYEKSKPCMQLGLDDLIPFFAHCWERKLVFLDIKAENFIWVEQQLKWIDHEPQVFTDNHFLNMLARGFVHAKYGAILNKSQLLKLQRTAINQFDIPEMKGFQVFVNRIFSQIIWNQSQQVIRPEKEASIADFNLKLNHSEYTSIKNPFLHFLQKKQVLLRVRPDDFALNEKGYFEPATFNLNLVQQKENGTQVSLMVKACAQDAHILRPAIMHILKQTASIMAFGERVLVLDGKTRGFLRQYQEPTTLEDLESIASALREEGLIDRYILFPAEQAKAINQKYFHLDSEHTHTAQGVPVAAQLYGIEQMKNDCILQMDIDVMIGRAKPEMDYLEEMIQALYADERVVSVGANIFRGNVPPYQDYFGFEEGGFVPEVRFCLLDRNRLRSLLPLPNGSDNSGLELSWYRSLEKKQKESGFTSIRGGASALFFIHPPNFKKKDTDVWFTMVDRVEQMAIPKIQKNEPELQGSYYSWTQPKRNEELVLISCFRNLSIERFMRYWGALLSQTDQDWGLILIDDASDNDLSSIIYEMIAPYKQRITFIQNRIRVGVAQNIYKAIHYFMDNPESVCLIYDADDALLGRDALRNILEKYRYQNADVVLGKMYRTDKLQAHYAYPANFANPRLYGGNVWQHCRSFKKYLYDALSQEDLKIRTTTTSLGEDSLLANRFSKKWSFPEHCTDYSYMIPIVEMSENPLQLHHFNYFHERSTPNTPEIKQRKEAIIQEILAKPAKTEKDRKKGRKQFIPNFKKIEIDITYACNLKCINCNRSSTQAPGESAMNLNQIHAFIQESIELNYQWELINILGGEPTLHPEFMEIVICILNDYILCHSPETILQITSNGYGEEVNEKLKQVPVHPNVVIDTASFKEDRKVPYFSPFNMAPIDSGSHAANEYHKGCWVTSYCGIGLNVLGYYPCGVAGGIDRVKKLHLGIQSLKEAETEIQPLLEVFCAHCGNFTDYAENSGDFIPRHEKAMLTKPVMSESWKASYKAFNGK